MIRGRGGGVTTTESTEEDRVLTIKDFVELSWRGMDDKVSCYAYLHTERIQVNPLSKI